MTPFLPGHTYPMRGGGAFYVDTVGADWLYGWPLATLSLERRSLNGHAFGSGGISHRDLIAPAPEPLTGECFKNEWEDGDFVMFSSKKDADKHAETAKDKPIRTAVRCKFVEVGE